MIAPPAIKVSRWLADGTRRFSERPVYATSDLEAATDDLVREYFVSRAAAPQYPLDDDDLARIVDALTSEFDSACDLSYIGQNVEGATQFSFSEAPKVMIDERLSALSYRRRRRMTIAHEIGHVIAHRQLFQRSSSDMMELFTDLDGLGPVYCFRDGIARGDDWMEWQASYIGAALLMPKSHVLRDVSNIFDTPIEAITLMPSSIAAKRAITVISESYDVSADAARVRLIELRTIEPSDSLIRLPLR